jgi:hypothetical protein
MRYTLEDEKISHSEFGVVKDEEYLLRVIYAPEHIKDGLVIESAISLEDLSTRGFSLDREMYKDDALIELRIVDQTQKSPDKRQSSSVSEFLCGDARGISTSLPEQTNERAFIIIDDAQDDNQAHASLYSAQDGLKRGALKKLRALLLPLLQINTERCNP